MCCTLRYSLKRIGKFRVGKTLMNTRKDKRLVRCSVYQELWTVYCKTVIIVSVNSRRQLLITHKLLKVGLLVSSHCSATSTFCLINTTHKQRSGKCLNASNCFLNCSLLFSTHVLIIYTFYFGLKLSYYFLLYKKLLFIKR